MTQVTTPTGDSKEYPEPEQVDRLITVATNPRDKAFVGILGKGAIRVAESIQLEISDIDFKRGTLAIVHLKERLKLKCPNCGAILGKRHIFCPECGNKVGRAICEKVEQR